jgi:hypothetical protein
VCAAATGSSPPLRDRRRLPVAAALLASLVGALAGCGPSTDSAPAPDDAAARADRGAPATTESISAVTLVEITDAAGLTFRHHAGRQDDYPMPAVIGGGAAAFDYDADGDLDLYRVDYGESATERSAAGRDRLYRLEADGRFADVTDSAGLGDSGRGMGCAVGDIDNDGDLDLFVSNWGPDTLWRNDGDGTFTEVSKAAGIGDPAFGTSAAFLDYDRDGWLDLFVARYVDFDPQLRCTQEGGRRDYCGPTQFEAVHDLLYRNQGGGRFRDVSREAGIAAVADAGLGVVAADFDDDGWLDLFVANDADPNHLWINQRDGTFAERAMVLGAAFNEYGVAEAGMGIAAGDVDGDGDLDVSITHLIGETNTLYENLGAAGFADATASSGLGPPGAAYTGFGNALFDFDNDGDLDTAVANGGVKRRPAPAEGAAPGFWQLYAEPTLLFANRGDGRFATLEPLREIELSRGLLPFDHDRDGDLDLLVTTIDGPAHLYRNDGGNAGAWIEIRALDPKLRREALGAKVTTVAGARRWVRHVVSSGGYLTSGQGRIHLGLGTVEAIDRFEVRWPDGTSEAFEGSGVNQIVELRRGEGRATP